MCGIGGIVRIWPAGDIPPLPHESIPEGWLDTLDRSIRHRGPDGQGRLRHRVTRSDGTTIDLALIHRRLSIIDPTGGPQPMVIGGPSDDPGTHQNLTLHWLAPSHAQAPGGPHDYPASREHHCPACGHDTLAVVFNGCIYNHREIRRELLALGHRFQSDHSDTEVLLHGWREWGAHLLPRLDGMYAFALWDGRSASWIVARDLAGEKPIAMTFLRGTISACCTHPAALAALRTHIEPGASRINADALASWIAHGFAPEGSLYADVHDLQPAQCIHVTPDTAGRSLIAQRTLLHQPEPTRTGPPLTTSDVDRLLTQAVTSRLESDVPLGCFLSGGVDSSLIAAMAIRAIPDLQTFCVAMPSIGYDESPHAAAVARLLGTRHQTISSQANPADDLPPLIAQLGLPFGDSSLLPTHWVARAARAHVHVALAGDGGDELFAGYNRHVIAQRLRRWRSTIARIPSRLLPARNPRSRSTMLRRLIEASRGRGYPDLVAIFPAGMLAKLLDAPPTPTPDTLDSLDWDIHYSLPGDILRKTDAASMAVALEVRAPFLSRDLFHACLAAPRSSLMPQGRRKGLLRDVARAYLPAEIVDRPKQGFAIPIGRWFRTDFGGMRRMLFDHLEGPDPFPGLPLNLNRKYVRRLLREHDAANAPGINPWRGRDHSQRLYMLLVLSIWARWLSARD
ncbi:MAG: asparagine synthase (glutamine-hydrolyzing) [Phycisphaeraceae bacterium]|nr:asparagine synthase (glutamine-hydrolyzing) [Phycisphaeraceae bacterium]